MTMDSAVLALDGTRSDYAADRRLRGATKPAMVSGLHELLGIETDCGKPSDLTDAREHRRWLRQVSPNSASFRLRVTRQFCRWLAETGQRDDL